MSDVSYTSAPDANEVPVNPYSLLEAVNAASEAARNGWALFLAIMTYVLVAVAGVTHTDLLLNSRVELPILQVEIELTRFFIFAPIVLLFIHLGLLVQHVMLARKVIEFDEAVRPLEATAKRSHPLRLELHSYFFTAAIAGPERSAMFGMFLHAMIWISFTIFPVMLLLYIQAVFLPYHDVWTTWVHRSAIVADIAVLTAIGVFLRRRDTSLPMAFLGIVRYHPLNFFVTAAMMALVLMLSFFVITVPGENLDRFARELPRHSGVVSDAPIETPRRAELDAPVGLAERLLVWFGLASDNDDGTRGFQRYLVVEDEDLVARSGRDPEKGVTVSLRGRDLRYAVLNRTILRSADLTGSDLTGAQLVGADLTGSRLACVDNTAVITLEASREATCTSLRGANLSRATLDGVSMQHGFLAQANFSDASLVGADLKYAELVSSNFSAADLRQADLSGGVELHGGNLVAANLQGANLTGAELYGADFSGAIMQAATLTLAQAQLADFSGAELDGANLGFARLQGARLSGTSLIGASLPAVSLWKTEAPSPADTELADFTGAKLVGISSRDRDNVQSALRRIANESSRQRLLQDLVALEAGQGIDWSGSEDALNWRELIDQRTYGGAALYRTELTRRLLRMSCRVQWSDGALASGLVRRALSPAFKGQAASILQRLRGNRNCPAAANVDERLLQSLAALVERQQIDAQSAALSEATNTDAEPEPAQ